jgi:ATP-dependent Lon protease
MRDFRDAKAMAQSLREALGQRHVHLTTGETLEVVSKMLGFSEWNTLAAFINTDRGVQARSKMPGSAGATLPVLPIKDWVPFPAMQMPLWIKRPKTVQALKQAFSHRRELVIVAQRSESIEEPTAEDVYDIGVNARVLDLGPASDKLIELSPVLEGTTQVLVQTQSRVAIKNFSTESGRYEAEAEQIDEGAVVAAPDLIERAANRFEKYATDHNIVVDKMWPLRGLRDPGRVADIIATRLQLNIVTKQAILATLDPVTRLERVVALLDA